MAFYAKLKHGADEIDLSSGDYCLLPEFTPPPPSTIPLLSGGTMLNRYSGGKRVDRSFSDRPMNIPLVVKGDSAAETHGLVRRLSSFIEVAMMDSADPLYFVFGNSDAVPYEPKWGQQFRYYEIKDAQNAIRDLYGIADIRDSALFLTLSLYVAPLATGLRQRVGSATGGILEHTWATPDGISRGVSIPPATTNKMTNPIFGHSTFDNDWTDLANITQYENKDKNYLLFGASSAKLISTDDNDNTFHQSIDVGNVNTHFVSCYAKLPDGGAVSTTQCQLWYGGNVTTAFQAVGDGWYRLTGEVTGVAAATNTGIRVYNGYTVYVDGFQIEEKTFPTPLCYGDMLDCAWTGTAHASTTTRTASYYNLPFDDVINIAEGTIRVAWMPGCDYDTFAVNKYILSDSAGDLKVVWVQASNAWGARDGTVSPNSSGTTFSAGDILVFHLTFGPDNGLVLYLDGTSTASNATYTPPVGSSPNYLKIGSDFDSSGLIMGTFMDVTIWDRELTAAEVSDDYDSVGEYVNGGDGYGQRLNAIPWLWTDDGDDILDNCYDSSRENFMIVGGIPGNVDAETNINIDTLGISTSSAIYLNQVRIKQNDYIDPSEWCFFDLSGTGDAAACGGEVERESCGSVTSVTYTGTITSTGKRIWYDRGNVNNVFFRTKDASATSVNFYLSYTTHSGLLFTNVNDQTALATSTAFDIQKLDGFVLPDPEKFIPGLSLVTTENDTLTLSAIRNTGTANLDIDYIFVPIDRLMKIEGSDIVDYGIYYSSRMQAIMMLGSGISMNSTSNYADMLHKVGDIIEFTPNYLNMLMNLIGDTGEVGTYDDDVDYSIYVKPRWSVL